MRKTLLSLFAATLVAFTLVAISGSRQSASAEGLVGCGGYSGPVCQEYSDWECVKWVTTTIQIGTTFQLTQTCALWQQVKKYTYYPSTSTTSGGGGTGGGTGGGFSCLPGSYSLLCSGTSEKR